MNKRYFVNVMWGCSLDGPYEKCDIGYANQEDEEHDGFNFVGKGGNEGQDFFIVDSLEDAIVNSHFNPYSIKFNELNEEDIILKDEILQKYEWDTYYGLVKKEKNNELSIL